MVSIGQIQQQAQLRKEIPVIAMESLTAGLLIAIYRRVFCTQTDRCTESIPPSSVVCEIKGVYLFIIQEVIAQHFVCNILPSIIVVTFKVVCNVRGIEFITALHDVIIIEVMILLGGKLISVTVDFAVLLE